MGEERADAAFRYFKLGEESHAKGKYPKAIGYYEKSPAINRETLGEKHPGTAIDYNNLGGTWDALGQYPKAIGYYEKALAIDQEALGEKHPEIAANYNNLGVALCSPSGSFAMTLAYRWFRSGRQKGWFIS